METMTRKASTMRRRVVLSAIAGLLAAGSLYTHVLAMGRAEAERPAASEFGFGPIASAKHLYTATLEPQQPLRLRQLQTVPVRIVDANGRPIEGAAISVDGGMPEHAHGLPTRPRVTRALGDGRYEIEGLRFSMGGWWELKLAIETPAGADSVTFNLSL